MAIPLEVVSGGRWRASGGLPPNPAVSVLEGSLSLRSLSLRSLSLRLSNIDMVSFFPNGDERVDTIGFAAARTPEHVRLVKQ